MSQNHHSSWKMEAREIKIIFTQYIKVHLKSNNDEEKSLYDDEPCAGADGTGGNDRV